MKTIKLQKNSDGGLILGYYFDNPNFEPIYTVAGKKFRVAWKTPYFIKSLASNPAPLLLKDRWFYDEKSFTIAIQGLKKQGVSNVDKLEYLFKNSPKFEAISLEEHLIKTENIDRILNTINHCLSENNYQRYYDLFNELEGIYGRYAEPNPTSFELMNAGIVKTLSNNFPLLSPLDDIYRSKIYESLSLDEYFYGANENQTMLEDCMSVMRPLVTSITRPSIIPVPCFEKEWHPQEFIEAHNSQGVSQLQEIFYELHKISKSKPLTKDELRTLLNNEFMEAYNSIPKTRNMVVGLTAIAGFFGSALTGNFLMMLLFSACTYSSMWSLLDEICECIEKKQNYQWVEILNKIYTWEQKQKSN